jgi:alpha-amylase
VRRIALALVLHNHQPVGNFGWVMEEVHRQAYRPMLEALARHPGIRVAVHYSGPLLEWLLAEHPESVALLRQLSDAGQVEIVGGGWAEPILPSLPLRDRIAQLETMASRLEALFGRRPAGAWLAERVWEPDLPVALAAAGYRWTVVDDSHVRAAALPDDAVWAPRLTEDQGATLTLFATDQGLRYRIPFAPVEEVVAYLRDRATADGERLATMGDDGEKFGSWPTTYPHCWEPGGWIDRFFAALEANAEWLTTMTPSGWLAAHPPAGRIYVPTASYAEMGEWALPPDEAGPFAEALRQARAHGRPEARWLRGASWRNFLVKYREANDLHKRMLRVSAKVAALPPGPVADAAREHLHRGQANDAYWHGLFGGLYLPHLRLAVQRELIAAEDLADGAGPPTAGELSGACLDVDLDGRPEVLLTGPGQLVVVVPHQGGGISQWDLRAVPHALASVLRRRPEAYHRALVAAAPGSEPLPTDGETTAPGVPAPGGPSSSPAGETPPRAVSIHERQPAPAAELAGALVYDDHERLSGLVRWLPVGGSLLDVAAGRIGDAADLLTAPFAVADLGPGRVALRREAGLPGAAGDRLTVQLTVELGGSRHRPLLTARLVVRNDGSLPLEGRIAQEWNLNLLGGGATARWEVGEGVWPFHATFAIPAAGRIRATNDDLEVALDGTISPPGEGAIASVETVSTSEAGLERVHQGSCFLVAWPVRLAPGGEGEWVVRWEAICQRDWRNGAGL